MHHVPPSMVEISLHKRQKNSSLFTYLIVLFLSNISCLQLSQMFYRGQLCELDFQILDHKQSRRPPKFAIRFNYATGIGQPGEIGPHFRSICVYFLF